MPLLSLFSTAVAEPALNKQPLGVRDPVAPDEPGDVPLWRSGVLVLFIAILGLALWVKPPPTLEPQAGVIMELPHIVGDYYGVPGEITQAELEGLPEDTKFAREDYDDLHGHQIRCTIVLSGAEQRSLHRPEACLTGQGWTVVGQADFPIRLSSGHQLVVRDLSLERMILGRNNERIPVKAILLYWFVGQNVTTPSHFTRIFLSNWDRVVHNRAHRWSSVSLFSLVSVSEDLRPNGLNSEQTKAMMADFARQVVPTFQKSEMPDGAVN